MKGRDGKSYALVITDKGEDAYFKVVDVITGDDVDEGWFVISKNGVLRIEHIK